MNQDYEKLLSELKNERRENKRLLRELALQNNIISSYKQSVSFQENLYSIIKKQKDEQSGFYMTELKKAADEAEYANKTKSRFLADMSHEMRMPLTVVSVNVQTVMEILEDMSEAVKDHEAAELLADAQSEIMRLARMVGGMLTLYSICENTERQKTDFTALCGSAADTLLLVLQKRGNILEVEIEDGLTVFASPDLLSQIIINLIQNAHAHTENGIIKLRAVRAGAIITVSISDNGSGIPQDILPQVFERGVTSSGGTGFGLYLCKSAVESHGGKIWLESEPGKGTAVYFTLPVYEGQFGGDEE